MVLGNRPKIISFISFFLPQFKSKNNTKLVHPGFSVFGSVQWSRRLWDFRRVIWERKFHGDSFSAKLMDYCALCVIIRNGPEVWKPNSLAYPWNFFWTKKCFVNITSMTKKTKKRIIFFLTAANHTHVAWYMYIGN